VTRASATGRTLVGGGARPDTGAIPGEVRRCSRGRRIARPSALSPRGMTGMRSRGLHRDLPGGRRVKRPARRAGARGSRRRGAGPARRGSPARAATTGGRSRGFGRTPPSRSSSCLLLPDHIREVFISPDSVARRGSRRSRPTALVHRTSIRSGIPSTSSGCRASGQLASYPMLPADALFGFLQQALGFPQIPASGALHSSRPFDARIPSRRRRGARGRPLRGLTSLDPQLGRGRRVRAREPD